MPIEPLLRFSDDFVICCGTVSLDLPRSKLLILRWRRNGEYFLPKGRKDIGEDLGKTALRETFEESGYRVELLATNIRTRATIPVPGPGEPQHEAQKKPVTEPVAVTQRATMSEGLFKIIFWFAATGDSTHERVEGTQTENEDYDSMWLPFEEALGLLSYESDKTVATKVVQTVTMPRN